MYIINLESLSLSEDKVYKCNNGLISNYLITICGLPPLGKLKGGEWCFMRTDKFEKCFNEMPFYYRIFKNFK